MVGGRVAAGGGGRMWRDAAGAPLRRVGGMCPCRGGVERARPGCADRAAGRGATGHDRGRRDRPGRRGPGRGVGRGGGGDRARGAGGPGRGRGRRAHPARPGRARRGGHAHREPGVPRAHRLPRARRRCGSARATKYASTARADRSSRREPGRVRRDRAGRPRRPRAAAARAPAATGGRRPADAEPGLRRRPVARCPRCELAPRRPDPDDLRRVVETALAEDLRYGHDATTAATVPADAVAVGGAHRPRAGRAGRVARRPRGAGRRARRRRLHGPHRPRRRRPPRRGRRRAGRPRARPRPAHGRADGAQPRLPPLRRRDRHPAPGSTPSKAPAPASATPARPCPACGCWRSTPCAAAAGSTTGSASATPC